MSIRDLREALKAAGIAGAATATMRYGVGETQIYTVNGLEIERPAGEVATVSAAEVIRELKAKA